MQKVNRVKLGLDFNEYNDLKKYFRKESSWCGDVVLSNKFQNGYCAEIKITKESEPFYSKYNQADMSITLHDDKGCEVEGLTLIVDKISSVTSLFVLNHKGIDYIISIDKEVPLTQKNAISRLNIIKWNSLNYSYVKNLVLFNNFNNDFELIEATFAVLYGLSTDIRDESVPELTTLLKEKFEYFGYDDNDIVEIKDVTEHNDDTAEKVLNNLVGNLLAELYYPKAYNRFNKKDMQDYVYSKYDKYLLLLTAKGVIPEE